MYFYILIIWEGTYWFFVKNHFRNFHQIFTFWDSLTQIILDRIIGLDWKLAQVLRAQKERMSSLTSHLWLMVQVLSIKNVFIRIQNFIFSPKYTRYCENIQKQNSLFQRDLQICPWLFFNRSYIFRFLMKNIIKNKNFCFPKNYKRNEKNFYDKIVHLKKIYTHLLRSTFWSDT